MFRTIENDLKQWMTAKARKPLIINGLRQVGKTWIMKNFADSNFENFVYVNFDTDQKYQMIFQGSKDPDYIMSELSLLLRQQIQPEKTLILFDEIQSCNAALNALKYFNEDQRNFFIIAAGSYLGISMNEKQSFPVGQVEILDMNPMSFVEFLLSKDEGMLVDALQQGTKPSESIHTEYTRLLFQYYLSGGMPESLSHWNNTASIEDVEKVQDNILNAYYRDFGKYPPSLLVPKIMAIWESIVPQLGKENSKFMYSSIRKSARAREYEVALEWLLAGRYLTKVSKVNKLDVPLKAYEQGEHFKLYLPDIGLMRTKSEFPAALLKHDDSSHNQIKGALAETYALQELKLLFKSVYYWADKHYEIDYLIQYSGKIWPIEVKFGKNLASKSLKMVLEKNTELIGIRYSLQNLSLDGRILNIPLYMISETKRIIDQIGNI